MNIHNTLIPLLALCMQIHTANVTRGWKGKCIRYWGRQTGFMGRGSSWASTLEAGIQVSWDEAFREHWHLRQAYRSHGTKLFVSIDTWGRQTGLIGRSSSWASTLEAGRQVSWDEALREHRHLRQADRSHGKRLFVSIDAWGRQTVRKTGT